MESTPQKMKAFVMKEEKNVLKYLPDTKDVPKPGPGQVLIKVECGVINPSDLYCMRGDYSGTFEYPFIPGTEGSGTVIASGGGFMAWSLVGKRVGFTRQTEKPGKFSIGGAYAEYCVTSAMQCVTLPTNVNFEQGACMFVNPLSAVGLLDRCKFYGAKTVVQTGASSQLGRMIIKYFKQNGVQTINIVRRDEQIDLLKNECGADYVLNQTKDNFQQELTDLCQKLNANVAIDAVAGDLPGKLLMAMGNKAVVISYGALSD